MVAIEWQEGKCMHKSAKDTDSGKTDVNESPMPSFELTYFK
jgi:hypothetical protein